MLRPLPSERSIYPFLKNNCKHFETAAELASVKKENADLKKTLEDQKVADALKGASTTISISAGLGLASIFMLYIML